MSGQPNQPPRGWNRGGPPSPIHYRPPSPWAPSPPPIISGPRRSRQSPARGSPMCSTPMSLDRSTPMSPLLVGAPGMRGTRGPQLPCPRPRWPGPQQHQHSQQQPPPPVSSSPSPHLYQQRISPSPPPIGINGPKPYRQPPFSPIPNSSYSSRGSPVRCHTPSSDYAYNSSSYAESPQYVGVPLEPPQPKSYIIYDDEEEQGPSTREIIANQSQDYVDEKLAEYQMTIMQLQGKL